MTLFLPALLVEPELLALSLGIAAAALIVAEVLRVGRCPWIGPRINSFMTAFIDSRDQGLLLISHFSLLIGMAAPLWLALPVMQQQADPHAPKFTHSSLRPAADASWSLSQDGLVSAFKQAGEPGESQEHALTSRVPAFAFAGIIILGIADSAASAVGRRFGRHKILRTHKSLEGTLGGIVCTVVGWLMLSAVLACIAGLKAWNIASGVAGASWTTVIVAVVGSCVLEAVTTQLDNIFLPLHHCALLAT